MLLLWKIDKKLEFIIILYTKPRHIKCHIKCHFQKCQWAEKATRILGASGDLKGKKETSAEQQFNGFAFGATQGALQEVHLRSHVEICLLDSDGNQVDADCPKTCAWETFYFVWNSSK